MLKLYNTLSRKKEIFRPRNRGRVNFFVCGPTVYDYSHIGHARTYIAFDVIAKYLKSKKYNVFYLQNITDIDDKIIKRAEEKATTPKKIAGYFEKEYLKDVKSLLINSVKEYARATDHIKEIIGQTKKLLKKGFAYQIEDGIYYDISKFKNYGKLSKRTIVQAQDAVSRIDESKEKRNKGDFCLWKLASHRTEGSGAGFPKPNEPKWKSPWGFGRPGWHIEDTAITEKYFGPRYDIHGGAKDLIFPHHEAEIAQMEAVSGQKPLVKYWLHTGFLTVSGQKMAKSLGNFITIKDFIQQHTPPGERILRFLILKTHYRSPINYNKDSSLQAKKELEKIDDFVEKIIILKSKSSKNLKAETKKADFSGIILKTEKEIERAMDDDFNTPEALASIFKIINRGNSLLAGDKLAPKDAKAILNFFKNIDAVFNVIFWKKPKEKTPATVLELTKQREGLRETKNWREADEIRKKIESFGYKIEDTKKGPKIKKF